MTTNHLAVPACLLALAAALPAAAQPASFAHKDWDLVCDNTRTCRAVGYHGGEGPAVSVLLTRKAGPHEPVVAAVRLGSYDEGERTRDATADVAAMSIDGRALGDVRVEPSTLTGALSPRQTEALLAALVQNGTPRWTNRAGSWTLSGAGATAVLLKMDELQGRVDTPGALVRKGSRAEDGVPPPLPAPVVTAAPLPVPVRLPPAPLKALEAALIADGAGGECESLGTAGTALSVRRAGDGKLLVSALCHSGSANTIWWFWTANAQPPHSPRLIADDVTQILADGVRSTQAMHDCASDATRTWDGTRFVLTHASSAGSCAGRGFIFGAWELPTVVSTVRPAPRRAPAR